MSVYLHPESLSPDPLYGSARGKRVPGGRIAAVHPHRLARVYPEQNVPRADAFHLHRPAPHITLRPDTDGRVEVLIDFGTELEAELEFSVETASAPVNLYVAFGESVPEAEGWGKPTDHPLAVEAWHLARRGRSRRTFDTRGFRYVRLQAFDVQKSLTITRLCAHAWFAFDRQRGDFQCDDTRLQRVWQSSVYTARICARPEGYWDGIKRDRVGWFGDARVTQLVADAAFADPEPAMTMLLQLPVDTWTMGIPGYTFAAVAMFLQHLLSYGTAHPATEEVYARIRTALAWAKRTQRGANEFLKRDPRIDYFGTIPFFDWSPMPLGGTFEQISCLQCQYVEGLRMAAVVARWLGHPKDATAWTKQADALAKKVKSVFWRRGRGMVHTLAKTTKRWEPLAIDSEYPPKFHRLPSLGESGPSRHSQTFAVWAGLVESQSEKRAVLKTLQSKTLPPLITAYFRYFELTARAECGDATGAILSMRDYIGDVLESFDSPTLWEFHDPAIRDFRAWCLGDWPKSLCHPWGGGIVPLLQRYLFGIRILEPGWKRIAIQPEADFPCTFHATIPTPRGEIVVERSSRSEAIRVDVPREIAVDDRRTGR
jgi:alpha-L-rhamnosidase